MIKILKFSHKHKILISNQDRWLVLFACKMIFEMNKENKIFTLKSFDCHWENTVQFKIDNT